MGIQTVFFKSVVVAAAVVEITIYNMFLQWISNESYLKSNEIYFIWRKWEINSILVNTCMHMCKYESFTSLCRVHFIRTGSGWTAGADYGACNSYCLGYQ